MKLYGALIALLLILSIDSIKESYSFAELGWGRIEIDPLSTQQKEAVFESSITGSLLVNITIYFEGKILVEITLNNVTVKVKKSVEFRCNIEAKNKIKIRATNYGTSKAVIYENSTITIYRGSEAEKNEGEDNVLLLLKTAFICSIALPPLLIYIFRKRYIISREAEAEVIVV